MKKTRTGLTTASLATLLAILAPTATAGADIFQWERFEGAYQESTMLAPDGAGANAVPGADLSLRNLTRAYLVAANLSGANFTQANLTQAAFSGSGGIYSSTPAATLTGANFSQTNLTDADFGGYAGFDPNDPGIYYYLGADLTGASLVQANLTGANFVAATLANADFSHTKLNANFTSATLTGANLTGADVRGAGFNRASVVYFPYYDLLFGGITPAQLYSTASYQDHDLTGIGLGGSLLAGANLAGQNLASANFSGATLTGANLTGAEIQNANFEYLSFGYAGGLTLTQLYSTASYLAHDLNGVGLAGNKLTGADLAGQNLANATFHGATLTNADLSGATLTNARFSAVSYSFTGAKLSGANLSHANLAGADFSASGYSGFYAGADLTGANLSHARLTNAKFYGFTVVVYDDDGAIIGDEIYRGANLTNANLSGADARGANFSFATLTGANTSNLIQSDGHMAGLDLTAGASLVVRDYDGNPAAYPPSDPLPIVVDQQAAMDATGVLRMEFEADAWDSTISFAAGTPVTRGGTLELTFADGLSLASQIGRTFHLFDWTGVNPTGTFGVSSPNVWDLSKLYTTGEVTFLTAAGIPGDFNNDNSVDAADYVVWRKSLGTTYTQAAYNVWRAHFGQTTGSGSGATGSASAFATVPEPTSLVLILFAVVGLLLIPRPRVAAKNHC